MNDDLIESMEKKLAPESIDPMPPYAQRGKCSAFDGVNDMLSENEESTELY